MRGILGYMLARLLQNLKFVGEGAFARVYEFGDSHVIKVPIDCETRLIRTVDHRQRYARHVVAWSTALHGKIGPVIVKSHYYTGGTIVQKKIRGLSKYQLKTSSMIRANKELARLVNLARVACESMQGDPFVIDACINNMRFNEDGSAVEWFDPVIPSEELFK